MRSVVRFLRDPGLWEYGVEVRVVHTDGHEVGGPRGVRRPWNLGRPGDLCFGSRWKVNSSRSLSVGGKETKS